MNHKGFTLIELMIVVAIIGILVAVGMPQYQNYAARSQVAEGFSLASGLKTALAEYYSTNGTFPNNGTSEANTVIGVEAAKNIKGKYVEKVTVSDDGVGAITVLFGSLSYHDERFLRLTAIATDGAVSFPCTTDIEKPYRPTECEDGVADADGLDDVGEEEEEEDPVPWAEAKAGDNACWDQEYAEGAGSANGWVVGNTAKPEWKTYPTDHNLATDKWGVPPPEGSGGDVSNYLCE